MTMKMLKILDTVDTIDTVDVEESVGGEDDIEGHLDDEDDDVDILDFLCLYSKCLSWAY